MLGWLTAGFDFFWPLANTSLAHRRLVMRRRGSGLLGLTVAWATSGLVIAGVEDQSLASSSGAQVGDIILKVGMAFAGLPKRFLVANVVRCCLRVSADQLSQYSRPRLCDGGLCVTPAKLGRPRGHVITMGNTTTNRG